jgi:hypothetical protein
VHSLGKKNLFPSLTISTSWNHGAGWFSSFWSHFLHFFVQGRLSTQASRLQSASPVLQFYIAERLRFAFETTLSLLLCGTGTGYGVSVGPFDDKETSGSTVPCIVATLMKGVSRASQWLPCREIHPLSCFVLQRRKEYRELIMYSFPHRLARLLAIHGMHRYHCWYVRPIVHSQPGSFTSPHYTTDSISHTTKSDASDDCWSAITVVDPCKPASVAGPPA